MFLKANVPVILIKYYILVKYIFLKLYNTDNNSETFIPFFLVDYLAVVNILLKIMDS